MAFVQFYRGKLASYNPETHKDVIFFAQDTGEIIVNNVPYGYFDGNHKEIKSIEYTAPEKLIFSFTDNSQEIINLAVAKATDSIEESSAGFITAEDIYKLSKIEDQAQVNTIEAVEIDDETVSIVNKVVKIDLTALKNEIQKNKVTAADNSIIITEGTVGKTVTPTTVQVNIAKDGNLDLTESGIAVGKKALIEYKGDGESIAVSDTDDSNTRTISAIISTTSGNILNTTDKGLFASLKLKKVDISEDENTVAAKYGLFYTNTQGEDIATEGAVIDILKDRFLENVSLGKIPEGKEGAGDDALIFTFSMADGTSSTVYVNVTNFLFEAELGNGLTETDVEGEKKFAVKIAAKSEESFLNVDENGVYISGIVDRIKSLTSEIDTEATKHLTITKTVVEGKIHYSISESDIASKEETTKEILANKTSVEEKDLSHLIVTETKDSNGGSIYTFEETDIASAKGLADLETIVGDQSDSLDQIEDTLQEFSKRLDTLEDTAKWLELT